MSCSKITVNHGLLWLIDYRERERERYYYNYILTYRLSPPDREVACSVPAAERDGGAPDTHLSTLEMLQYQLTTQVTPQHSPAQEGKI